MQPFRETRVAVIASLLFISGEGGERGVPEKDEKMTIFPNAVMTKGPTK